MRTEARKFLAKAISAMNSVENNVWDGPGKERRKNGIGEYYSSKRFAVVLENLDRAMKLDSLDGYVNYLKGAYLAWANRLTESKLEYEAVICHYPAYSTPAKLMLAGVVGRLGNVLEAARLLEEYNSEQEVAGMPFMKATLEGLSLDKFVAPE